MSDATNPPLPDQGPGDETHEGDSWELDKSGDTDVESSEEHSENAESATTSDGALSPGSTATDSPTALD